MLMAYAKAGTNRNVVNLLGKSLRGAEYYPKTVHGPSRTPNKSTIDHPICGSGKGSTDGTAGWTSVCNTLLKVYSEVAESAGVKDLTVNITLKEAISAFIDDVKTRHLAQNREAGEK